MLLLSRCCCCSQIKARPDVICQWTRVAPSGEHFGVLRVHTVYLCDDASAQQQGNNEHQVKCWANRIADAFHPHRIQLFSSFDRSIRWSIEILRHVSDGQGVFEYFIRGLVMSKRLSRRRQSGHLQRGGTGERVVRAGKCNFLLVLFLFLASNTRRHDTHTHTLAHHQMQMSIKAPLSLSDWLRILISASSCWTRGWLAFNRPEMNNTAHANS